jgi:hypothetical protein
MPKLFESKKKVGVTVERSDIFDPDTFRTTDIGDKGGMTAITGKTKEDVKNLGVNEAPTRIQRYNLSKQDVEIKNTILRPKTNRGKEEIESIELTEGKLEYVGESQVIPVDKKPELSRYFKDKKGGIVELRGNKLNDTSVERLRKKGVPETLIKKMKSGKELTETEKELLHKKKLEYVKSLSKTSFVREYKGGTEGRLKNLKKANIERLK